MLIIFVEQYGAKSMKILELYYQMIQFSVISHKIAFFSGVGIHIWQINRLILYSNCSQSFNSCMNHPSICFRCVLQGTSICIFSLQVTGSFVYILSYGSSCIGEEKLHDEPKEHLHRRLCYQ